MQLRDYQVETIEIVKRELQAGVNRQLVKWPTGTGKGVLFSALPDALGMQGRMLVIAHREELITQAAAKLRRWNPGRSVGIEMAEQRSSGEQIVVASVQTIGRAGSNRLKQFNPGDFAVVVCDECHRGAMPSYRRVFDHFNIFADKHRLLLGLTATPNRSDGRGLDAVFEKIVYDFSIVEAIRKGWLVDLRGVRITTTTGLDVVHTAGGDFNEIELARTVNTPARNDLAARAWLDHGQNRQTVVFAVNVDHAQNLADAFKRYGVAAEAIWADDPQRADKLAAHRAGDLRVIINVGILTEGYDDWRIGCVLLVRPTKSELLYVQCLGRTMRIPDGIDNLIAARNRGECLAKEDAIVIDLVDSTKRHDLTTLPTLFGLNKDMNLRGRSVLKVLDDIQDLRSKRPFLDIAKITDLQQLAAYAQPVDLFNGQLPPDILQVTEYQWHKTRDRSHVRLLPNGDWVVILRDAPSWLVVGHINGRRLRATVTSLNLGMRYADAEIALLRRL